MDELIGRIRQALSRNGAKSEIIPLLPRESYTPLPFSIQNFHFLDDDRISQLQQTIAFIDGGQAELLSSPDLCVGVIRVCCCAYKGRKRAFSLSSEFYVMIVPSPLDGDVGFEVEIFPIKGDVLPKKELLSFSSSDETIRNGIRKATPSSMLPVSRRFAELEVTSRVLSKLNKEDMVVLDGTLQQWQRPTPSSQNPEPHLELSSSKSIQRNHGGILQSPIRRMECRILALPISTPNPLMCFLWSPLRIQ